MRRLSVENTLLILIIIIYSVLGAYSLDFCYFWDNIQITSSEAHFFLKTNFSIFPTNYPNSEFRFTGHPPTIGFFTALLWNIFGYHLWVSHLLIYIWALILIYNTLKLAKLFFSVKHASAVTLVLLLEPTILTQFVIASPDIILLTAFIISIRAIIEQKRVLLAVSLLVLFSISMRGIFAGIIILMAEILHFQITSEQKWTRKHVIKILSPYTPSFIILIVYYSIYLNINGWFFTNSPYAEHYVTPSSLSKIFKHLAEFGIRSIENGRLLIWGFGIYTLYNWLLNYKKLNERKVLVLLIFLGLFTSYTIFIFITQMPFMARYFMPLYILLSIIAASGFIEIKNSNNFNFSILVLVLALQITGNFWIYPEKIAKPWDSTLGHISYYALRKECFSYIDDNKINYQDISADFCMYGNRKVTELYGQDKHISSKRNKTYHIYSNISNTDDSFILELKNKQKWIEIKRFKSTFVCISIYKRISTKQ